VRQKKALKIKHIDSGSNDLTKGLQAGDRILSINGHPITDIIDYYFYTSDTPLTIEFLKPDNTILNLKMKNTDRLGISFHPLQFHSCGNNCIFCFVDQNPPGLRKTLYEKDEDYRLSFLYGNYVTLTNTTREDLQRIVKQRLSPLYISIHALQPSVRKKILGIKKNDHLLKKISFLTDNKIELHAQIVLCPGINDGTILNDTILTLSRYYPYLKTLAIVPVGLTKHRKHLPRLQPVTPARALSIISRIKKIQQKFKHHLGNPFVFLADEFYLLGKRDIPSVLHYGEYQQIDNGVGLTRHFIDEFTQKIKNFKGTYQPQRNLIFITGKMAYPVIEKFILPHLNKIKGMKVEAYAVENTFYGKSVTVSGLLTGRDIINTCSAIKHPAEILLPENCVNNQGLFLDNLKIEDIRKKISPEVRIIKNVKDIL